MEVTFCKVDTCRLCNEMKKREYLKSSQNAEDRLDKIIARYSSKAVLHEKPINWADTDYEYQVWKDNSLSIGAI